MWVLRVLARPMMAHEGYAGIGLIGRFMIPKDALAYRRELSD